MPSTFQSIPVLDVLTLPANWDEINHGQLDDNTFEGRGLGLQTPWKVTSRVKRKIKIPFLLETRAKIKAMRDFIVSRGTRRHPFWCPLLLNDYGLTQNASAGATELHIKKIGLLDKFNYGAQFRFLALLTASKFECYEIAYVDDAGTEEKIGLTTALATDLVASQTNCVGLMMARLADDENQFDFQTDEFAKLSLNIVELPMETVGEATTGAPVFLYRITRGDTEWRFTSWQETVTAASEDWTPIDIDHGEFTQDSDFSALTPLKIAVATDDSDLPFRVALDRNISEVTTIEVFETDFDTLTVDLDAPLYSGRMGKATFGDKGQIDIELSTILRIAEQQVPTTMAQRPCNNRLFDEFCALDPAPFQVTGTITSMSDDPPYIEATAFGAEATSRSDVNWFALGKVEVGTETRFCVGQSGNRLYLNARFRTAAVGGTAVALPGCDKRNTTCVAKFSNGVNFLGFAVIPNKNPQFEELSLPKTTGGKK